MAANVDEKEITMKLAMFLALTLLAGVSSHDAYAWTYIVVDGSGHEKVYDAAPWDLTYPPKNTPVPVIDGASSTPQQGTPLTPQQEARRLNAKMLIITNVPAQRPGSFSLP
jgi:hypothetical protein